LFAGFCGGKPFISNNALAKITGNQNSIGMARPSSSKQDGMMDSARTARPFPVKAARSRCPSHIWKFPTPNIATSMLALKFGSGRILELCLSVTQMQQTTIRFVCEAHRNIVQIRFICGASAGTIIQQERFVFG
jgi:hypothetical protein